LRGIVHNSPLMVMEMGMVMQSSSRHPKKTPVTRGNETGANRVSGLTGYSPLREGSGQA